MEKINDAVAPQSRPTELPADLYLELSAALRGDVYLPSSPNFHDYSKMFNGDVKCASLAVACPLDAQDVSKIISFCQKNLLSLSIKAGGYGTAGWAVGGDIIVDLNRITQIDIEAPNQSGGFTSIRDMPPHGDKGKSPAGPSLSDSFSGKRRREEDTNLRIYTAASQSVHEFLHPAALQPEPPLNRRRLDSSVPTAGGSPGISTDSYRPTAESVPNIDPLLSHSSVSMVSIPSSSSGTSTKTTTVSSQTSDVMESPSSAADPFAYLDDSPSQNLQIPSTSRLVQSIPTSLFASPGFLDSTQNILTYATPKYTHAYVTFGAGMRQKEIDQFCAANPLEAVSLAGGRGAVPYHIPFAAHPVGSAVMLLGGFGFLGRLHGLSIDNLVEAEVVLADGSIVIANENEYPDLWWALRGAGPAFGVVTRYKARAYPVPVVFAGNLIYRFHRATAPSLIKHFRDCVKGAPRELYANVLLTAGPAGQDSLVVIQMCYVGLNEVDEKSFFHQQDSVAQVLELN